MSEDTSQPRLVNYYAVYAPSRFQKRNGKPLGYRSYETKIKQFDLPVIYAAQGVLIDPERGDAKRREFERKPRQPIRPGRPRKKVQA